MPEATKIPTKATGVAKEPVTLADEAARIIEEHGRVLWRYGGAEPGPTVILTGSLHGNEPAGVVVLARIGAALEAHAPRCAGRVVAVAGNLPALEARVRYIDRDLNRRWTAAALTELRSHGPRTAEDREQLAIADIIDAELSRADAPAVILDLHTTSGAGAPFCCLADTVASRTLAAALPVPMVLGLEEILDGSMLGYLADRGHAGVAFEGGAHDAPDAADNQAAAVWTILVAAGSLHADDVPELAASCARLADRSAGVPRAVEIRYRHAVTENDDFVMTPGHASFDAVFAGQVVGRDGNGPVCAPFSGRLLMPRYQGKGEDGFFLVREVPPPVAMASLWLRRVGADRLLPLLPGVERHPEHRTALVVSPGALSDTVAAILATFGYRRKKKRGPNLVVARRGQP
ncbi:MAG TPA: succinylglutamate desuccinylase/aspartoacylase family protein [Kofleriaceae bacterium]|nr:succinylglutamate desuccinylase/aspartoacylase family protein [Kofleriaceae bacterium]